MLSIDTSAIIFVAISHVNVSFGFQLRVPDVIKTLPKIMQPDQEKVIFVATLEHWKTLSIPNKEKLAELADLQFPPRGRKSASALTVKERDETFLDMIKNQQPNHMVVLLLILANSRDRAVRKTLLTSPW